MTPIIIGNAVRGASHIKHNIERQDSFLIIDGVHKHGRTNQFYSQLSDDVKIIAVADGHGSSSCPYSKTGSQTAVNVFCDTMAEFAAKYRDNMQDLFITLNREGETARLSRNIVGEWEKRILRFHGMEKRFVPLNADNSIDADAIWKQYGTTLLGMMITNDFIFVLQLGDGDITYVDENKVSQVIDSDKILGVETHSISKPSSWRKIHTRVISLENVNDKPFMYILSTDGWQNSHASEADFHKTCKDYFNMIQQYGTEKIDQNIPVWLSETSEQGCGDDITVICAYFSCK
ncbi:MAG: protein phosphatase 2C domain-containing protein [Oscillospiraceae bacterium]